MLARAICDPCNNDTEYLHFVIGSVIGSNRGWSIIFYKYTRGRRTGSSSRPARHQTFALRVYLASETSSPGS